MSVSLTMATSVDDVTDQLLVECFWESQEKAPSSAAITCCARLRSSNIDASADSPEEMQRVVAQIRVRWPKTRIILRGNELGDHAFE